MIDAEGNRGQQYQRRRRHQRTLGWNITKCRSN